MNRSRNSKTQASRARGGLQEDRAGAGGVMATGVGVERCCGMEFGGWWMEDDGRDGMGDPARRQGGRNQK